MLRSILFISILFCLFAFEGYAQIPSWVNKIGSNNDDDGYVCKVGPNNNVYVAGRFSGTMDLDPSASTYNITCNGADDMFLACYTSTGVFLWGFHIGGSSYDGINDITVDSNNNVIVVGYFAGTNIDFNPSPSATFNLTDKGTSGGGITWGGDGFVAKFSSTGVFQWAIDLGGSYVYDFTTSVSIDTFGNVYAAGMFTNIMDIDPTAATVNLNSSTNGKCYLIKYSPSGQLIWGKNFGSAGIAATDNVPFGMFLKNGVVYLTGFFQGTADFDPSASVANLVSNNTYDAFIAKYDTAGNYISAWGFGGSGQLDFSQDIRLDSLNNIYVTGYTNSPNMDFNGSATGGIVTSPGGGGNNDIFLAKYNNSGTYQWGKIIGGIGADVGYSLNILYDRIYCTGTFANTVDFDPSAATANLISAGNTDIYVAQYDLSGNYICSFKIGGALHDEGRKIVNDNLGYVYITGQFSGTNVDFDPSALSLLYSSNGGGDIFLAKYNFFDTTSGGLVGDTICAGQQAYLTYTRSSGTGPFSVTFSNGTTTYTYTNIFNGVPFALNPNPLVTTTYTLTSGNQCLYSAGATVLVHSLPTVNAGKDTVVCIYSPYYLNGTGSGTYSWTPASALNNASIANPQVILSDTSIAFVLSVTDSFSCNKRDTVLVAVRPVPTANAGNDTTICKNVLVQLHGSGALNYSWYPTTGLSNSSVANPTFTANNTITYSVIASTAYGCKDTDDVFVTVNPAPTANAGLDTSVCIYTPYFLSGSGSATSASWSPALALSNSFSFNPQVLPIDTAITFVLSVTDGIGCVGTDTVNVSLWSVPTANAGTDINVCDNAVTQLHATGGATYNWYPSAGLSNANTAIPYFTATSATTLYVEVTSLHACKDTDDIAISVIPSPTANAGNDTTVCPSKPFRLHGSGSGTYAWYPSTNLSFSLTDTPTALITGNTTFSFVVSNAAGCSDTDYVTVTIVPMPAFNVTPSAQLCIYDSVHLQAFGGDTYSWSPAAFISNTGSANPIIWPSQDCIYSVTITENFCGRSTVLPVNITVHPLPTVHISDVIDLDCGNTNGQLTAVGAELYIWSPAASIDSQGAATTAAHPDVTTTYTVIGTDIYGCKNVDSASLYVNKNGLGRFFIPSSFTPNGDTKNDCFRIHIPGKISDFTFMVFDRWGNRVYLSYDNTACWDGTFNGEPLDMGTYYYYYKGVSSSCGKLSGKGDLTLIR